ncbi:hypothetical protein MASR1M74_28960 [Lentimicrobium sp.]
MDLQTAISRLIKAELYTAKRATELRDLTRYRKKMIQQVASEKNRIVRILEDSNVKLSSILSDTSGVVATKSHQHAL